MTSRNTSLARFVLCEFTFGSFFAPGSLKGLTNCSSYGSQGNERSCCDLWKVPFAVVLVFLLVFTLTNLASIKAREEQMSKGGKYLKVEIEERVQWRRNVNIGEQSKKEDEAKMIKKSTRGSERKEQDEALGASRLETNVRRGRRKESSGRRKLRESEKSTNTATPATLSGL